MPRIFCLNRPIWSLYEKKHSAIQVFVSSDTLRIPFQDIRDLLDDVVLSISVHQGSEELTQTEAYNIRLYSPSISWTVTKHYSDFVNLHSNVEEHKLDSPAFKRLLEFEFPRNRDSYSCCALFEEYLRQAIRLDRLVFVIAEFLNVKGYIGAFTRGRMDLFSSCHSTSTDFAEDAPSADVSPVSEGSSEHISLSLYTKAHSFPSPYSMQHGVAFPRAIREREFAALSSVLTEETAHVLCSFLPTCAMMQRINLAYATQRDGWSMLSLLSRVGTLSPLILVTKSLVCGAVFGVYVSTPLAPPDGGIGGDGRCFVFRLDGDKAGRYGCQTELHRRHSENCTESIRRYSTCGQFLYTSADFLSFGGSSSLGSNAIRFSSDLTYCSSGASDTYLNPRLVDEQTPDPFKVSDIEIFHCGGLF
mmetsp:Transcript_3102/g.4778  ORF Transcript_3102/g.4778 Transcript_3102/m.4778 type:complete len:417 (+) Transcript_3102:143-1393(+)